MSLEISETEELIDRFKVLVIDYQKLSIELAKNLEKYGKIRQELIILSEELNKRKINIDQIEISIGNEKEK